MPFQSQAQRRFMYAKHPEMAKEWEAHTPKGKKLPEHKGKKDKEVKEGGLQRFTRLTGVAKKKGVTPRALGGKTPQQVGITDPKTIDLAKKVKSTGLKQRMSEQRRGGIDVIEDKRRMYAKGKIAMNEDQRIDALLGSIDPVEDIVLKSEDEKIADILNKEAAGLGRYTRQMEGAVKRVAKGQPADKIVSDTARSATKLKAKSGGGRGAREAYKKLKDVQRKHGADDGVQSKEALGPDMAGEAGAAGAGMPPAMGSMPGPGAAPMMPPAAAAAPAPAPEPAPVAMMQDPIEAENEQLKKMIENMELKKQLMEMNSAATGVSGAQSADMVGTPPSAGAMPPATPEITEDPMNAMRKSLSE